MIGFIGIGRMGGAMAERLLDRGFPLVISDASPEAVAPFVARGAIAVDTPRDVADRAEAVFACLPSVAVSLDVATGAAGVIHGKTVRQYVEMSTIGRSAVHEIGTQLAAVGIDVVDAPVSGGPSGARAGTLSVILAGTEEARRAVSEPLAAIAPRQFLVGNDPGLAQMCKLVNNAISLVGMALASEALVVGARAGLDPTVMLEVVNNSTGRNSATAEKFPKAVLTRTFDYGGPIGAGPKDLQLFLDEAERYGIPTEITAAGAHLWRIAVSEGDPDRDFTRLVQTLERWAGVELDGRSPSTGEG